MGGSAYHEVTRGKQQRRYTPRAKNEQESGDEPHHHWKSGIKNIYHDANGENQDQQYDLHRGVCYKATI